MSRAYSLDPSRTFRTPGQPGSAIGNLPSAIAKPRPRVTPSAPARGPLSNTQKAKLSIAFRQAWALEGGYGDADAYRHAAVLAATGKLGLTACTQDDYRKLCAKAAELIGEDGEAVEHHLADQSTPERIALHKLREALREKGKPEAYAAAIARSRFKCSLEECSAKQLWWLVYSIRNAKRSVESARSDRSA